MGGRRWWILVALIVAMLPLAVDLPLLVVAVPALSRGLGTAPARAAQAAAVVPVGLALLLPAVARTRRGSARVALVGGLLVCLLGQAVELTAGAIGTVVLGRVVLAAGAALTLPAALRVVGSAFEPAERPRAVAIWAGFTGLAVAAAPVLGGAMVDEWGWRGAFGPQLPLLAAGLAGLGALVPASLPTAAAGPAAAAAPAAEREAAAPLALFALMGSATALSIRLQVDQHEPALRGGVAVAVALAAFAGGARGTSRLLGRFSRPAVLAAGALGCAAALAGLAATDRAAGLLLVVLAGAGAALVVGTAARVSPVLRLAGGGAGVAVLGSAPPATGLALGAVVVALSAAAALRGWPGGRRELPPA